MMNRRLFRAITREFHPLTSIPFSVMSQQEEEDYVRTLEGAALKWCSTPRGASNDYAEMLEMLVEYKEQVIDVPTLVPAEASMILLVTAELVDNGEPGTYRDLLDTAAIRFMKTRAIKLAAEGEDYEAAIFHIEHTIERAFEHVTLILQIESALRSQGRGGIVSLAHLTDMVQAQEELARILNGNEPSNN